MEATCYNHEVSGKKDYHWNDASRRFGGRSMNVPRSVGHFLDFCFLCKKPLGNDRDIYMYRGDIPFCTVECRGQQIEEDEAKAKKWNVSSSVEIVRSNEQSSLPTDKSGDCTVRTGSVAV